MIFTPQIGSTGERARLDLSPEDDATKLSNPRRAKHTLTCDLDEDCTCTPSEESMIDLTTEDLCLISDALRAHEDFQISTEPDVEPARRETVRALSRWAATASPGPHAFDRREAGEVAEALNSLIYWELAPEDCRHSGEVYDENGETPAECAEADLLLQRFQGLYTSLPEVAP